MSWIDINDPEVLLAATYVPVSARKAWELLFGLDLHLANVVRTTTEPMIGTMRLTWWRDAIEALGQARAPDEPLLQALSAALSPMGLDFARLSDMAEGWVVLLDPMPLAAEALDEHARLRGGSLFAALAVVTGAPEDPRFAQAGEGWALVDFAFRCSDRETAEAALVIARKRLEGTLAMRWPKPMRAVGALAHMALRDAQAGLDAPRRIGSPGRVVRMLRHRLTGR
ncbi:squalene/phytoene synthase family protein [Sphingomonas sp. C3-2]|uniref:squalene/phytoene synthase family protein n=1 Tax=Sphingomonas sp. C3-2 TaxID=3062169 RepID=UPI00294B305B|nr:squalene/phytoene synthase family protein [Sphingomonas sp. C3-2]WOK36966.1 squalene/phytoene synthase family protein [Sphingomonas sp. C3-2]